MDYAILDENPYPIGCLSYNIWHNNKNDEARDMLKATDRDQYLIYLYIMDTPIRKIANVVGVSEGNVHGILNKYHVK